MSNVSEIKAADLAAKMLSPLLGALSGGGATFVVSLLRTTVESLRKGHSGDAILASVREPKPLKSWGEIGAAVDAEILEDTRREKRTKE